LFIINPGIPDETFLSIALEITKKAKEKNISLRLPWGAHMTTGRFKEVVQPEYLTDFFKLMKEAPIVGKSSPYKITISHFILTKEEFIVILPCCIINLAFLQ
jgi:hypothetical protein